MNGAGSNAWVWALVIAVVVAIAVVLLLVSWRRETTTTTTTTATATAGQNQDQFEYKPYDSMKISHQEAKALRQSMRRLRLIAEMGGEDAKVVWQIYPAGFERYIEDRANEMPPDSDDDDPSEIDETAERRIEAFFEEYFAALLGNYEVGPHELGFVAARAPLMLKGYMLKRFGQEAVDDRPLAPGQQKTAELKWAKIDYELKHKHR
jgi:hypothetical protein